MIINIYSESRNPFYRMFFNDAFLLLIFAALLETFLIYSMGGGVPR